MKGAHVLEIDGSKWSTPLTAHAGEKCGTAELVLDHHDKGSMYRLEGVHGEERYQVVGGDMPVVGLEINGKVWMVDDPLHWWGMKEAVDRLPGGTIYVAGLGMGLMLHHMIPDERFTDIVVIEREPDVIDLIAPTLPDDGSPDARVKIVEFDWWEWVLNSKPPDGVLFDLAVGDEDSTGPVLGTALGMHLACYGDVPLVRFGVRTTKRPEWMRA
jgi:hypothetical protein